MRTTGHRIWQWPRFGSERPGGAGSWPGYDREIGRMVMDQLAEIPDVRTELVTPLRLAIEEKRYYVPEDQVAERMLRYCARR